MGAFVGDDDGIELTSAQQLLVQMDASRAEEVGGYATAEAVAEAVFVGRIGVATLAGAIAGL